jgi:hypothetical protein
MTNPPTTPDEGHAPLTDEALAAFTNAVPACERTPLWVHLDWSLWGTGLGDTLREPMASAMVTAIPPEVRAHAEMVMAEFLKWRGVESPALASADLRAEVDRLRSAYTVLGDEAAAQCMSAAQRTVHARAERDEARAEAERLREENAAQSMDFASVLVALHEGTASDGYHTHNELYEYRMLYNAHAARGWLAAGIPVSRSKRHCDGEPCFGGGWFVVVATLPTGQVSNHYRLDDWDLFDGIPELPTAPMWDGHTPADAADRLRAALRADQGGDDRG